MFKMPRDKFILIVILFCAFIQGLNAGLNSYYGYYTLPELELMYVFVVFFLTMYYVKELHLEESESIDFGFNFMLFYPILFPYAMIKKKKWVKGIAFVVLWYIVMNISYYTWITVDFFMYDPSYE